MLEDKDFELLEETPVVEEGAIVEDADITEDDFTLTEVDESVHEQKFQTRPTTFFRDSMKRFRKNKSSVVATFILGGLLVLSFAIPVFDRSDTVHPHPEERYLAPKLFNGGTGFWDGTVSYNNIAVDFSEMPDAQTKEDRLEHWWPSSEHYPQRTAISNKKISEQRYVNALPTSDDNGTFGKEGYVQFGYYEKNDEGMVEFSTQQITKKALNLDDINLTLSVFDVYDVNKIKDFEKGPVAEKTEFKEPTNYNLGECALYFKYETRDAGGRLVRKEVQLVDYALVHNIGSAVTTYAAEPTVNVSEVVKTATGETEFTNASFAVRMLTNSSHNTCCLIGGIVFDTDTTLKYDAETPFKQVFDDMSFTDATSCLSKKKKHGFKYWNSTGVRYIYLSKGYFCSFTYDTYEAAFGDRIDYNFSKLDLLSYVENGWLTFDNPNLPAAFATTLKLADNKTDFELDTLNFYCKILDKKNCPLVDEITIGDFYYTATPDSEGIVRGTMAVKAKITNYKYLGYKSMPKYLMGTDKSGRDMLKYVFEGLRTSLLLGVITFLVCFTFGLIWGSISGYFGGTVDLAMERIMEIFSGIPWMVAMTLIIIHLNSSFVTLAIALCATGWMSTASRTRTQFYRFKGREYVLASRTLGASDARLIVKHILPNSLGTIITGAVLMIPTVIFSESGLAFLGLIKNLSSIGVILYDNQPELLTSPYLLLFPAILIALLMISFNLFGNGLRDAVNPSLKGED